MLTSTTIEFVSCGEYSSCAVSISGELFSWGDGTHGTGLLGQVSCGPWHTALVTSFGQLFTFGDGTFGVLGHGDCNSTFFPREVDSLKGLRTVRVSCGVWHSAAVVKVMEWL
ncbi:hypothetical protein KP509_04G112600 [Ceratopteris richardii]|uniref:Uncharacterized protein n=1 Tax=Ceratopteris richardii TaxID=49495 RepID=A0A8T2UWL6_CERRI|nr:hypothetical protein KP509_04G112600 [Ceratopteris richardii]